MCSMPRSCPCCKCRKMPFHACDNLNIKLISPIPVSNPSPSTANCHCRHPVNSYCRACSLAQQCCICYLSPNHNCKLMNNVFLHWHSNSISALAKWLCGGMWTPEESTPSPAPSPPLPVRQALHKLTTRPLTPPPAVCLAPCVHASPECIHCQTNECCCKCGYWPHYAPSYNPDCSVCFHAMSKCLTCVDIRQCHECLLRLTMANPGIFHLSTTTKPTWSRLYQQGSFHVCRHPSATV